MSCHCPLLALILYYTQRVKALFVNNSALLNFVSLLITSCSEFQQSVIKLLQPLFPTFPNYYSAAERN